MGVEAQIAAAGLTMLQAKQQRNVYEMEAQLYHEQSKMAEMESSQQENQRLRALRSQLASLNSTMSAQGVAIGTSPSVTALEDDEKKIAKQDINSIQLMGMSKRRRFDISASSSKAAGKAATLGGLADSAGIIAPRINTGRYSKTRSTT